MISQARNIIKKDIQRHSKNGMVERIIIIVFNFRLTQSQSSKFKSMLQASLENIFSVDSRSTCVFIILVCNENCLHGRSTI